MTLTLSLARADLGALDTPLLALALAAKPALTDDLRAVDAALGGALGRVLERRDFRGARDETLHLAGGARGPQRVLLVGTGAATDRAVALKRAAALAARRAGSLGVGAMAFHAATPMPAPWKTSPWG